jgi:hypothetical protein
MLAHVGNRLIRAKPVGAIKMRMAAALISYNPPAAL